jgi:hypothetical protein
VTLQDHSGSIETAELKKVIEKCGLEVSDAQVREMIKEADTDGSGTLEFDEFLGLMWRLQSGPSERELRNEMFTVRGSQRDMSAMQMNASGSATQRTQALTGSGGRLRLAQAAPRCCPAN